MLLGGGSGAGVCNLNGIERHASSPKRLEKTVLTVSHRKTCGQVFTKYWHATPRHRNLAWLGQWIRAPPPSGTRVWTGLQAGEAADLM